MSVPGFTGARIDRCDATRNDPALLGEAMTSMSARLLRLEGIDPIEDGEGRLAWGSMAEAEPDADLLFLGKLDGKPRFVALPGPNSGLNGRSRTCMRVLPFLAPEEVALYGAARSLVDWHARHQFCSNCGAPTQPAKGGWQRNCSACGSEHYPRTDPVVIMLAEHGDDVLVGRQPMFPKGNYSALAGFVEPGESLEEAVIRELFEESGIRTSAVRYVASQPWPFPSSLMVGCVAVAENRDITLDTNELEDAMWVSRAQVVAALAGDPESPFKVPPPMAIAHTLLTRWAAGA
jgi:NAD+ diphosphatase